MRNQNCEEQNGQTTFHEHTNTEMEDAKSLTENVSSKLKCTYGQDGYLCPE